MGTKRKSINSDFNLPSLGKDVNHLNMASNQNMQSPKM